MNNKVWLRLLLAGIVWLVLLSAPGVTLPGSERLGFVGAAAAQQQVNIDDFYDALDPYGQWVWHPRFGYVWLPENVSQSWRPYTVGHWEYTDEYGWYWDSREPFAWAVYHYGRWGYDDDYGWFWVPGDTWAPAWVQWRYSDDYVGWAPIGPRRGGYAYGAPVNYDPPVAESWVFVQPQYMTSRAISHYAVPIAGLGAVFIGATNVYRPQFRGGVVYNYGMPRDRVVQIIKRPIYVQKIYKVDNWKNGGFDKGDGHGRGIKIYAPGVDKDSKPERGPKRFADQPNDFKPKAKLKDTYKGDLPKGFGQSAKDMKSVVKEEGPDAFNKKHGHFAPDDQTDRSGNKDKDNDQNARGDGQGGQGNAKGFGGQGGPNDQNAKGGNDQGNQGKPKNFGGQGGPDQFKQGNRDQGDQGGGQGKNTNFGSQGGPNDQNAKGGDGQVNQGKPKGFGGPNGQGGSNQFKQGNRDNNDQGGGGGKPKGFGGPNGQGGPNQFQGGPNQFKQGNRNQDDQGGGGGKPKGFGGPNGQGGPNQFQGGPNQFKQGNRNQDDQGGGGGRPKGFGGPNGQGGPNQFQGGPNQFKQGNRNQDDQGGGGQGKPKNFGGPGGPGGGGQAQGQGGQGSGGGDKKDKCQKHPEKPECQN